MPMRPLARVRISIHGWTIPCILFGVISIVFLFPFTASAAPLILNDTNEAPLTTINHDGFVDIIATEAFRRAGLTYHLVKRPAERALIDSNKGILDGELSRIEGLEKQYPNLVRVPEVLVTWLFTAFSKQDDIPANLAAINQHTVGFIKGWKIFEQMTAGAKTVLTANDPNQLFRMLHLERVEVILYMHAGGNVLIEQQGLRGIHALTPPLATRDMFIYLNKRHAKLIARLSNALRNLKADGFYQRTYDKALSRYRSPQP
ncbi:MAG: transporter substrate-binding domain-containing protein [Gammaproteobacteria bacterium]|nr:transporter substrate-binding domain-containing protein [Gammaproteobacteria bacterium]